MSFVDIVKNVRVARRATGWLPRQLLLVRWREFGFGMLLAPDVLASVCDKPPGGDCQPERSFVRRSTNGYQDGVANISN